jgi:hypothetical protein
MVQGFIFEGDLQFSKLFKNTICKGVCTVKCTEKRFIPFYLPPFSSLMSSLGRYVFGSEISYNKAPPRLPGLGC